MGRANDLGEAGCYGCVSAAFAYLSLIILAHWGQDILSGQNILRGKDIGLFLILLVGSVAGGRQWLKYGFVKGRYSW